MILNGAAIRAANTSYRALFKEGFDAVPAQWEDFCEQVTSTTAKETYQLPGGLPALRKWVGDRNVNNLRRYSYELENEDWELTVGVPRNAFEDDQLGLFNAEFRMLGAAAKAHPDVLFAQALEAGVTAKSYDGVAFFATNHPSDKGFAAQSNKLTLSLSATNFSTAITAMRKLKNRVGEPVDVLNMSPDRKPTLIVPPDLESTARDILLAERLASGATNTNYGRANLQVNTRLTSATAWYLLVGKAPMRPFIHQWRKKPALVARDQPGDDAMWNRKEVEYGVDGRWALGYGEWRLALGSVP